MAKTSNNITLIPIQADDGSTNSNNLQTSNKIVVYVPMAANDTAGIATYDQTYFDVQNGEVHLKNTDVSERPSLVMIRDKHDGLTYTQNTDGEYILKTHLKTINNQSLNGNSSGNVGNISLTTPSELTSAIEQHDGNSTSHSGIQNTLKTYTDDKVSDHNSDEYAHTSIRNRITALETGKQDKLNQAQLDAVNSGITAGKIMSSPTTTSNNPLVNKSYVDDSINQSAAYYITYNAQGDAFPTKSALTSATVFYSGGVERTPTRNDYCIVRVDESQNNTTTRYSYQNGQWNFQYIVNETAYTEAQLAAINSGITAEKIMDNPATTSTNPLANKNYVDTKVSEATPTNYTDEEIQEMCDDVLYPALPAPQNVSISGTVLSFDAVEGAETYYIYADGETLGDFTPASSVGIIGASATEINPNDIVYLEADILPETSKDQRVIWSIEGDGVITYYNTTQCVVQAGSTIGNIVVTATAFNNSSASDSITIHVVPEPVELLNIDYSDGTIGSPYNNAHWLQEKYNNGWQTVTGQMNCRADPNNSSNKVVNMVTGYFMNYRYTYTPDTVIKNATSLSVNFGNYFSGAQPLSVKISIYDDNNNQIYIAGDASNYVTIPVTTSLINYLYTFSATNITKIQFLVKNSVNSNSYLYTDNIIVMGIGE